MVIACSGASHSGKTTFMNKIQSIFGKENVEIFHETIRTYTDNIDHIREFPNDYLDIQFKVDDKKIGDEKNSVEKNKIVLFDRSLFDNFFYYTFYVDKAFLTFDNRIKYFNYLNYLKTAAINSYENIYNLILLFDPLNIVENTDPMRPKDLQISQSIEYDMIKLYTYSLTKEDYLKKVYQFSVENDYESLINTISTYSGFKRRSQDV